MRQLLLSMFLTLKKGGRVAFPEQEAFYQDVHRQIHNSIDLVLPEHRVGNARDSVIVGDFTHDYILAYESIYRDLDIRRSLQRAGNKDEQKTYIFSIVAELVQDLEGLRLHGAVISNVIHDALHDMLTDLEVREVSSFCKETRKLLRSVYYRYLTFKNEDFRFAEEFTFSTNTLKEEMEDLKFVLSQLEVDIGISSKYFLESLNNELCCGI